MCLPLNPKLKPHVCKAQSHQRQGQLLPREGCSLMPRASLHPAIHQQRPKQILLQRKSCLSAWKLSAHTAVKGSQICSVTPHSLFHQWVRKSPLLPSFHYYAQHHHSSAYTIISRMKTTLRKNKYLKQITLERYTLIDKNENRIILFF